MTRMQVVLVVAWMGGGASTALAGPAETLAAQLKQCTPYDGTSDTRADALASAIGAVTDVAAIHGKPLASGALVTGKKGKAYVFFATDRCDVVPIAGKAAAYAKGTFGGGATVAYAVQPPSCNHMDCPIVVSVKTADDKLVDAVDIGECTAGVEMRKVSLRTGRDSLIVGCWNSGGADRDRTDVVVDFDQALAVVLSQAIGVAWIQTDATPMCAAKPPGGIAIITAGDAPVLDVSRQINGDEAAANHIDFLGGGCEQNSMTTRMRYDSAKKTFVADGKPRFSIAKKLCDCKK